LKATAWWVELRFHPPTVSIKRRRLRMKVTVEAQATVDVSPADYELLVKANSGALVQVIARADVFTAAIAGIVETPAEVAAREEQERLTEELAQLEDESDYVAGTLKEEPTEPVVDEPAHEPDENK
jgi:hypothetical protein